jgi:hypothetical protein
LTAARNARGDDDRVYILARIKLVIVAHAGDWTATALFLDKRRAFVTATVPNIGYGDELEVQLFRVFLERGD